MIKEVIIEKAKTEGLKRILRLIQGSVGAIVHDENEETIITTFENTDIAVVNALEIEGVKVKRVEDVF